MVRGSLRDEVVGDRRLRIILNRESVCIQKDNGKVCLISNPLLCMEPVQLLSRCLKSRKREVRNRCRMDGYLRSAGAGFNSRNSWSLMAACSASAQLVNFLQAVQAVTDQTPCSNFHL